MEVANIFSHFPDQLTCFLFFPHQPLQWDWSRRSRLPVERWEKGRGQSSWRRSMWTPKVSRASLSSKACSPTSRCSPSARSASSWPSRWWVSTVSCVHFLSLSLSRSLFLSSPLSGYRTVQESSLNVLSHLDFLSQLWYFSLCTSFCHLLYVSVIDFCISWTQFKFENWELFVPFTLTGETTEQISSERGGPTVWPGIFTSRCRFHSVTFSQLSSSCFALNHLKMQSS